MFTIHLDPEDKKALYEQIYDYIKNEIYQSRLVSGEKLPSTRSLAGHLSVSRNTVDMAYTQLLSEGYLESREKSGYFVGYLPKSFPPPVPAFIPLDPPEADREAFRFDFSPYAINTAGFPYLTWQKLTRQCTADCGGDLFLLGNRQGEYALRCAIRNYLYSNRGVQVCAEDIIIGAGADYLLQLLVQLLGQDKAIAVEDPAYLQAYRIFRGLGCRVEGIPVGSEGMPLPAFLEAGVDAAYLTASHQYPLGVVMPVRNRCAFLDWAAEKPGRYLIEDDHDSEFRYRGKPMPALKSMDTSGTVVYLGTFSRSIAPAIRIGYMVLPPSLMEQYRTRFSHYASTVSRIDQVVLAAFINGGYFERHLRKSLKVYKNRRDAMVSALKRDFKGCIHILPADAGLHLVVRFPGGPPDMELVERAKQQQINVCGLSSHLVNTPSGESDPTLLLGFANHTEEEIGLGIRLLSNIL